MDVKKNKHTLLSYLLLLLICVSAITCTTPGDESNNRFSFIQTHFKNPGAGYRSAPLWVWNTTVTKPMIDSMLQGFKANGFGGVFVHPRPGLVTPYLSDEWNDLFAYTVQQGKALDMQVWIYDENSYPSGFAGGHVPDQMPASYNQGQLLQQIQVSQLPDTADLFFLCLKKVNDSFTDVTGSLAAEKGKKGTYYLFTKSNYHNSDWYGGFSYVDLMVKGVTEKFIDVTMKGYEEKFGNEFGKTVPGIFSDEPNVEVQGPDAIRWTPDLFPTFKATWGYDLTTQLPCLLEEVGDWKKVRHNYYQTLLQLFIDRWSKPFYHYTESKNLQWTGHYWEHEWPRPNQGIDNMAMYAWHQRPGIDMLFNQFDETGPHAQFGNVRSVKELSSVANQLNKTRTLSETYGGGGWELTFKDMKRLGDWEYVLGVNTLNQHLSYMTIRGARKYDYPQSFSYHTPWWPQYKTLNDYFGRLSLVLSSGKQENHILVLEPTTTAWMYYTRKAPNQRFNEIGQQFQSFVTALEKAQVEYDLGSENIIKDHGRDSGAAFIIGQRAYTTVVIPPGMENLDKSTFSILQQYAQAGGKVLVFEPLKTVDGYTNDSLQLFNTGSGNKIFIPQLTLQVIEQHFSSPSFSIHIDSTGGDLYHQRRMLEDGQLLFLTNASMDSNAVATITLPGKEVLLLDALTGDIKQYPSLSSPQGVSFTVHIDPAGSNLFFIAPASTGIVQKYQRLIPASPLPASTATIKRPEQNSLTIDFCDVTIGDTTLKDLNVYYAADTVFKHYGFKNGDPWNTSVQFKDNIIRRDTFKTGPGFSVSYHFTIGSAVDYKNFEAIAEEASLWQMRINGQLVQPLPGKWWLEKDFSVYPVGKNLQAGNNTLTLTADKMSVFAEIEPVYILGNFNVISADKGWQIVPPQPLTFGSWKTQGLPLYGQSVIYTKEFTATENQTSTAVQLGNWKGTVAVVTVNGEQAGIIYSNPYLLEISNYIKPGINKVEVSVTGSLKNLLGPHHNTPRPGLVSPWHFRNVRSYPPGSAYDLYDYGLMEDFTIVTLKQAGQSTKRL